MPTATYSPEPTPSDDGRSFSRGEADDRIYPVHTLDGAKYQHCILTLFIRFNDILDAEKIRTSLVKLLEIDDWRKLGGRFRIKGDKGAALCGDGNESSLAGKTLEIHVPNEFTAERPAIQFAHEAHDLSIFDHVLGQQLPQTSDDGVALSPPLNDLRLCGLGPGFPTTMADLVDKDAPQLSFKVIGFTDATVLAVTFSHSTWDISGLQGFMKSLELVLDGREDEVLPMLGARTDVLSEMVAQQDDSCLDLGLVTLPGQAKAAKEPRVPKAALEERIIRVPLHIFERMRDLVARENPDEDQDALTTYQLDELFLGLIVRQIARAQPAPRALQLMNIYNARLLVPQLGGAEGIYSQNLVLPSPLPLSHETATGPIAPIALAQRDNFAQAAVPQNIARSLWTVLSAIKADMDITALTDNGDEEDSILVNNLVRLSNYIDVDLSAAVVRQGEKSQTRRNGLGTADLCFLTLPGNSYGMMRVTTLGSYNGNACWVFGELPARAWELIYEALDELEL
ncbi:hypothetical protein LMH87_012293 [Akanthomyces muscarius]|uniref:Acetyltransferase n=1 Tax=Akanthomyces muscarius TaxID=2231603 RepID=A0A9W8QE75_AKAMU|nr:hypothetical protein LMH87_012293 [Akanthomyces muscarius]KAJ4151603.1 hypothetical protein LMH87_012293 [Akanthomyces muscarius]